MQNLAICCIVKDEPDLLEWIEYHRVVGVQHFYLYDNESAIPIQIKSNDVTIFPWSGKCQQMKTYNHCLQEYGKEYRWIAFIDADEFLVPLSPYINIPDILSQYIDYGSLQVCWKMFTSNGHRFRPIGKVIDNYTSYVPQTEVFAKAIVQPSLTLSFDNPHTALHQEPYYPVNELKQKLPSNSRPVTATYQNIQLNHYFLKSRQDFEVKCRRGFADQQSSRKLVEFLQYEYMTKIEDKSIFNIRK